MLEASFWALDSSLNPKKVYCTAVLKKSYETGANQAIQVNVGDEASTLESWRLLLLLLLNASFLLLPSLSYLKMFSARKKREQRTLLKEKNHIVEKVRLELFTLTC